MRVKRFEDVNSINQQLKDGLLDEKGRPPDNFVESAEGTIEGRPNIDTDPQGRQLVEGLNSIISEGYPKVKKELDKY
jgi:hypothetical protein